MLSFLFLSRIACCQLGILGSAWRGVIGLRQVYQPIVLRLPWKPPFINRNCWGGWDHGEQLDSHEGGDLGGGGRPVPPLLICCRRNENVSC